MASLYKKKGDGSIGLADYSAANVNNVNNMTKPEEKGTGTGSAPTINPQQIQGATYNPADAPKLQTGKGYTAGKWGGLDKASPTYGDWKTQALNGAMADPLVQEAQANIDIALEKAQNNSWKDKYAGLADAVLNRPDFSYDMSQDTLFQNALASAMKSGQVAMQNTMGQAAALTGGYGSSYATATASQAYNQYVQDAYNQLPEYYQMALNKYQMEGDELYRKYGTAENAYLTEQNELDKAIDRAYSDRDYAMNVHLNDLANMRDVANTEADWAAKGIEYETGERRYATELAESQRREANANALNIWGETNNNAYRQAQLEQDRQIANANFRADADKINGNWALDYQQMLLNQSNADRNYELSKASAEAKTSDSDTKKTPSDKILMGAVEALRNGGDAGLEEYINRYPDYDTDYIVQYADEYGETPLKDREFRKSGKDSLNWFGGVDNNDTVKDEYGHEYTLKELQELLVEEGMSKAEAKEFVMKFNKYPKQGITTKGASGSSGKSGKY